MQIFDTMTVQRPGLCVIEDQLGSLVDRYRAAEVEDPGKPYQFQILEDKTDTAMQWQLRMMSDNGLNNGQSYDIESPPLQACLDEITKLGKVTDELQEVVDASRIPLFESGKELAVAYKRMESHNLSTGDILRAAMAKYLCFPMECDFFYQYLNLEEVRKNVHRVELLLAAANMVETGRFTEALATLDCDHITSNSGDPIERIMFYFSRALRERICSQSAPGQNGSNCFSNNVMKYLAEAPIDYAPPVLAQHQMVPFCQIQQICAAQIIEEHVATANRIHVIDLAIRCGIQWVALMQALAARGKHHPVELLKITAIGSLSEEFIENTGERLELFARSLNLPFKFKMVMSSEIDILNKNLFDIEEGESVVVCAQFSLLIWIPCPDQLESLMMMIKSINPCVMVVNEVDWDFNSPSLFNRFREALFYFGSYFDCLEDCMDREDNNRMIFEFLFLGRAIKEVMDAEGEERTYSNMNMSGWRALFARFRMAEVDLSKECLYQADLVKNNFKCASSCTLDMDGKSLTIEWKGIPMHFVSAWKFQ